jgi:hypothetical protein
MAASPGVILVRGTCDIPEEMLEMLMESKKKSGGGELIFVKKYDCTDMALVVFKEAQGNTCMVVDLVL